MGLGGGQILGFPINQVVKAGVAVIAFPIVANQLRRVLPVSLQAGATGRWIVNIGGAVAVGWAAKRFLGQDAGRLTLICLGANLLADAVAEFFPAITTIGMGFYPGGQALAPSNGMGAFNTAGSRPSLGRGSAGYPGAFAPNDNLRLVR